MKNILLKGILLSLFLLFLLRGGVRVLVMGWKLFVPLLIATIVYFAVRKVMQSHKLGKKVDPDRLDPQAKPEEVIVICPHCNMPRGSCPKCR